MNPYTVYNSNFTAIEELDGTYFIHHYSEPTVVAKTSSQKEADQTKKAIDFMNANDVYYGSFDSNLIVKSAELHSALYLDPVELSKYYTLDEAINLITETTKDYTFVQARQIHSNELNKYRETYSIWSLSVYDNRDPDEHTSIRSHIYLIAANTEEAIRFAKFRWEDIQEYDLDHSSEEDEIEMYLNTLESRTMGKAVWTNK